MGLASRGKRHFTRLRWDCAQEESMATVRLDVDSVIAGCILFGVQYGCEQPERELERCTQLAVLDASSQAADCCLERCRWISTMELRSTAISQGCSRWR